VTENSAFKKAVRARMDETGEKYTEARRGLLAASAKTEDRVSQERPDPLPVTLDFPAETFTAVVGAGGVTNLGLVMPRLIDLARQGHPGDGFQPGQLGGHQVEVRERGAQISLRPVTERQVHLQVGDVEHPLLFLPRRKRGDPARRRLASPFDFLVAGRAIEPGRSRARIPSATLWVRGYDASANGQRSHRGRGHGGR